MDTTKFLSRVIGICFIIISIAFFMNMDNLISRIHDLINNKPLVFVAGCFTLVIGIMMVVSHNIWQLNHKMLVTIISWIVFLKGASIVLYPHFIDTVTLLFLRNATFTYICISIDFILGLILCFYGFRKKT